MGSMSQKIWALKFLELNLGPWVAEAWGNTSYVPKGSQLPIENKQAQSLHKAGDILFLHLALSVLPNTH